MTQVAQRLDPLEKQAMELLVQSAGIQYGAIMVEIQVVEGKRKKTKVSVTKAVMDKYEG